MAGSAGGYPWLLLGDAIGWRDGWGKGVKVGAARGSQGQQQLTAGDDA